jgi:hypothetical protein
MRTPCRPSFAGSAPRARLLGARRNGDRARSHRRGPGLKAPKQTGNAVNFVDALRRQPRRNHRPLWRGHTFSADGRRPCHPDDRRDGRRGGRRDPRAVDPRGRPRLLARNSLSRTTRPSSARAPYRLLLASCVQHKHRKRRARRPTLGRAAPQWRHERDGIQIRNSRAPWRIELKAKSVGEVHSHRCEPARSSQRCARLPIS